MTKRDREKVNSGRNIMTFYYVPKERYERTYDYIGCEMTIPLYEQIYEYIKTDIRNGKISCGEKLPSTRALAKYLEISRSTVELAYEQLLAEGYVGSGSMSRIFCDAD